MGVTATLRERLDYLVHATGKNEAELFAEAVTRGLDDLYRQQVGDAYLAGDIARERALSELGPDAVAELDYARQAVLADVAWGLRRG